MDSRADKSNSLSRARRDAELLQFDVNGQAMWQNQYKCVYVTENSMLRVYPCMY